MSNSTMEKLTQERIQAELLKMFEEIEESRQRRYLMRAEEERAAKESSLLTAKTEKESKYYVLGLLLSSAVLGALIALGSALLTKMFLAN